MPNRSGVVYLILFNISAAEIKTVAQQNKELVVEEEVQYEFKDLNCVTCNKKEDIFSDANSVIDEMASLPEKNPSLIAEDSESEKSDDEDEENLEEDKDKSVNEMEENFEYQTVDRTETLSRVKKAEIITRHESAGTALKSEIMASNGADSVLQETSQESIESLKNNGDIPKDSKIKSINGKVNMSPRLIRKPALRYSIGKRHNAVILNEDVLASFDIIDRTDVKEMATSPVKVLHFSDIAAKFINSFSFKKRRKCETKPSLHADSGGHRKVPVTVSLEQTDDGEQMQVDMLCVNTIV